MRVAVFGFIALLFCACSEREPASRAENTAGTASDTIGRQEAVPSALPTGDTILAERYANGVLKYLILSRDSGECKELHQTFYANGNLKSKGCQGRVQNAELSTGMSVGTWTYLDSVSGRVDSSFFYDNSEPAKAFIEKKTFYANGQLKAVETYNNYMLYETEPQPKGVWKSYNENGKVVRTKKY